MATRKEVDAAAVVLSTRAFDGCELDGNIQSCAPAPECGCRTMACAVLEAAEGERCKFFREMFGADKVIG